MMKIIRAMAISLALTLGIVGSAVLTAPAAQAVPAPRVPSPAPPPSPCFLIAAWPADVCYWWDTYKGGYHGGWLGTLRQMYEIKDLTLEHPTTAALPNWNDKISSLANGGTKPAEFWTDIKLRGRCLYVSVGEYIPQVSAVGNWNDQFGHVPIIVELGWRRLVPGRQDRSLVDEHSW